MSDVLEAVTRHPRVAELGRDRAEQQRVEGFARDLAHWMHGAPREALGPLARVITLVAERELRDARTMSRDRPHVAVEAAARATESLWELVRWAQEQPPPTPEQQEQERQTRQALRTLADGDAPELDALATRLSAGDDGEEGEGGGGDQAGEGEPDNGDGDEPGDGGEPGDDGPDADPFTTAQALAEHLGGLERDVTQGVLEADRVGRMVEQMLPGIGWATTSGQLQRQLANHVEALSKLLERLPQLDEIAAALGRVEEQDRRDRRREGGREEVVGVRFSGEVSQALPSELGLMGDPDTEDLFYMRWMEHRLVSLELEGAADEGTGSGDTRGPAIACIDTSASMRGGPEWAAKALVLAVCRQLLPQGRIVHLILFGGEGDATELRLARGRSSIEGLLDFLGQSFWAGTDYDGPLVRAVELLQQDQLRDADLLVVTDGLCRASQRVVDKVEAARAELGVRVFSVVLGRADVRGVDDFSDEVWSLRVNDAAHAAGLLSRVRKRRRHPPPALK